MIKSGSRRVEHVTRFLTVRNPTADLRGSIDGFVVRAKWTNISMRATVTVRTNEVRGPAVLGIEENAAVAWISKIDVCYRGLKVIPDKGTGRRTRRETRHALARGSRILDPHDVSARRVLNHTTHAPHIVG